ncbi:chemotaxis-specific protein-glutamate methyltransferase CheB [Cellulomonas persica]|uniref:Protein-glutamate methylesterase/protein-glutamine glutaminase n=1 Tax=Cellulomonas persica TaxID=76861 RepID=A0A510UXP2_9CELL|nr:chemotaxis-specific protein-glutamate methyltransferase CheB [Cellulomonas persica]GEK19454.1 chemotaxis response regulator protein-glutamate methylesterase of group 2 operon [Cellulomonas persica]
MGVIRVLVVDDSVVVRRLVSDALSQAPGVEVVGVAANGRLAQAKVAQLRPDAVTMDVEMPEMNGIEAVRALRAAGHKMPIIMFSTLTERGAAATLDALAAGATDYVAKPSNVGSVQESIARVADELVPRLRSLVPVPGLAGGVPSTAGRPVAAAPVAAPRRAVTLRPAPQPHASRLVVVGSSTGGPEALSRVLSGLTAPPSVPVLVVQHMPPVFTRQLATRLDRLGPATVVEAAGGEILQRGHVYIAPGDRHLEVRRAGPRLETVLTDGPPVNYCRPAVDVLFRSAVRAVGGDLVAVVLTGMGSDGRTACSEVVDAGGTVIVQDEPTSVVWGMPGAVAGAGFAHQVLPITEVAPAVERALQTGGAAA